MSDKKAMLRRGLIKLLKRFREGTLPENAREGLEIWYSSIKRTPVEKNSKEEIKGRMWSEIRQGMEREEGKHKRRSRWLSTAKRWAGVAAILGGMGVMYYFSQIRSVEKRQLAETSSDVDTGWIVVRSSEKDTRDFVLPDGSRVILEPKSELRYRAGFAANTRPVYLEGSGYFDVAKDPDKPFVVYAGAITTRVLGTSFTVKALAERGGTEVAVVTGKVIVEKKKTNEGIEASREIANRIVLTPNKKVTFFDDSDLYVTGLVEDPVVVVNPSEYLKPGAFYFDEVPLADVLNKLEKAYGVEIALGNDRLLGCPVTADLSSESLYGKMEIISAILNAQYEITGSTILLSGGGCSPLESDSESN